jgi:hypothetical protein
MEVQSDVYDLRMALVQACDVPAWRRHRERYSAARDAVLAFLSAPLHCEGCESGAPVVGVFDVESTCDVTDARGVASISRVVFPSTRYCESCASIVAAGLADVVMVDA